MVLAPTMPISTSGLASFNSSANFASVGNDGVLVCMITRSKPRAVARLCSTPMPSAGASSSFESGTSAAGCASQVGYQKDFTSRFA